MIKIITPAGAFGEYEGENELTSLLRKIALKYSDDEGEWADKYGTDFENEEFIMRTYYWGDCDCGWDEFESKHDLTEKHSKTCFQAKLKRFESGLRKPGIDFMNENYVRKVGDWAIKNGYKDGWDGCAVHCDCGRDRREEMWFNGLAKKFGTTGKQPHKATCCLILPNFLHKKTGFEVRWYKYLGRDMETNMKPPIKELKKLIKETKK